MTGYGKGDWPGPAYSVAVEIRSVNHRYCEVSTRTPRAAAPLEDRIRRAVQERVKRGRIDVFVDVRANEGVAKQVIVDKHLALAYYSALRDMQDELGLPGNVDVAMLAGLPGVVSEEESRADEELLWQSIEGALSAALGRLVEMREREGKVLAEDILARLNRIERLVSDIQARAPLMVEQYRQKLDSRIREILPAGALDETRLAMEVALYADRADISEEIVRVGSHLEQLRCALASDEAVGRRMDFLIQEINREINTIGSKAADVEVSGMVVRVKSELETIREQVQNIE
jgi:uncharacterized protein (TIGR00255 family)